MSAHGFATFCLIYLCAGSLMWVFLDRFGIVESTLDQRLKRGLGPPTGSAIAIATTMMILAWPVFAAGFLAGMVVGIRNGLRRLR